MNALLDKYIEEYDVERVMILGKNIVNRNVDDKESIDKFLCFLLDLAKSLSVVDEQRFYLDQAKIIISDSFAA